MHERTGCHDYVDYDNDNDNDNDNGARGIR